MTREEALRDCSASAATRIDEVDRRILELLNERTRVVEEIGRVKREAQAADLRAEARRRRSSAT